MKGKYITIQILLACLKKSSAIKKDIYLQLSETIAERKKLIQQYEKLLSHSPDIKVIEKDIHAQLAETIAAYSTTIKQWKRYSSPGQDSSIALTDKKAA